MERWWVVPLWLPFRRNGTERNAERVESVPLAVGTLVERNGTERNGTELYLCVPSLFCGVRGTERNGTERNVERCGLVPS